MAYLNDKKKAFTFDYCYQILKDHQCYSLTTTILNTQHSRCGTSDNNGGSSINIGDDGTPITIEGSDSNRPMGRNEAMLDKKGREKQNHWLSNRRNLKDLRHLINFTRKSWHRLQKLMKI